MATGSVDLTSLSGALKELWPQSALKEVMYEKMPLLGMLQKDENFEGEYMAIVVQDGHQQGVATNLADAQSNKSTNIYTQFQVTRANLYGVGTMGGEAIRASKSNKGAIVRGLDNEQKGTMRALKRHLNNFLWGNGGGSIGRVSSISSADFTLTDPTQSIWFEKDQVLQMSADDGTTGSTRSGTVTVSKVNRRTGVITCTGNVTAGISAAVADDYVFVRGCHGNTAGNKVLKGIRAWCPDSDPSSTAFFGVDRTSDPSRLAGLRYPDNTGGAIEETLQKAMAYAYREGSEITHVFMNPVDFANLCISLGSKAIYDNSGKAFDANVGYTGVKVFSTSGISVCYADPGCPSGRAFGLNLSDVTLASAGPFIDYLMEDGLEIMREASSDAYTWRMGGYLQLYSDRPSSILNITL